MDHIYSIIMFCMSAGLFLYAFIAKKSGFNAILRNYAVSPKDKQAYASEFAKLLAKVACLFLLSGIIAPFGTGSVIIWISVAVLIAGFILLMKFGTGKLMNLLE
ncbi:MAG: hypothetical protein IJI57_12160 [Flexilinea sp.]|nr:hypothetical protein [Flexilinea sp.]